MKLVNNDRKSKSGKCDLAYFPMYQAKKKTFQKYQRGVGDRHSPALHEFLPPSAKQSTIWNTLVNPTRTYVAKPRLNSSGMRSVLHSRIRFTGFDWRTDSFSRRRFQKTLHMSEGGSSAFALEWPINEKRSTRVFLRLNEKWLASLEKKMHSPYLDEKIPSVKKRSMSNQARINNRRALRKSET